jgi:hypothetical protein
MVHKFEILYLGKLKPEFILFFLNHVMNWQLHVLYSIELAGKEHKFSVGKCLKDGGMWLFYGIFHHSLGGNVRKELSGLR